MNTEEKTLIDGLFAHLKTTEQQNASRDDEANIYINMQLEKQPAAAYYMAQTILSQEAAIKKLTQQVEEQQQKIATSKGHSGSFLAGLFAGNNPSPNPQSSAVNNAVPTNNSSNCYTGNTASFLGGALQTAAGVAGGMLMANAITNLFHHSTPEEIIEVVEPDNTVNQQAVAENNSVDNSTNSDDNYQDDYPSDTNSFTDDSFFDDDSLF